MEPTSTRLNKYLSEAGYCSRRAADKLIDEGRVTINGVVPEMGTKVTTGDEVKVDGKTILNDTKKRTYIAFNKPVGIVCTTDTAVEKDNIIDYINYPSRIFPIGRLDKDSEGLILLTDDGDIVNKILRASNNHEKEYIVSVDKPISQTFIQRMAGGIPLEELGKTTKSCKVEKLSTFEFKIILTLVIHFKPKEEETDLHVNKVDGKQVPVPHFGVLLPWEEFETFSERLKAQKIDFIIEPYIRFKGQIGEQATLFFYDPAGNALEFKAFKDPSQIFAK